jgi:hypothetical protein
MKQSGLNPWLRAAVTLILLFSLNLQAKQKQHAVPRKLAVEFSVTGESPLEMTAGTQLMTGHFKRIVGWEPSAGNGPVRFISLRTKADANAIIMHLAVEFDDQVEVLVASYRLREGESVTADALTRYGVEPLVLKVVQAKPSESLIPAKALHLENRTKSVEIMGLKKEASPSEQYKLSLRNNSARNIIMVDLFTPDPSGHGGSSQLLEGNANVPAIPVGAIRSIRLGAFTSENRSELEESPPQTIIIRTLVFDDGAYEGDAEFATMREALRRGSRIQATKIL